MLQLDSLFEKLDMLPDSLIYLFLGLSAFIENLFPPIPGDTITAFGAFLVGVGRLHFLGVYGVTTGGSFLGFFTLFWLGQVLGRRFFIERDYRFFRAKDIIRAQVWFQKYGYLFIAINRFLPGVRSVISLSAGICRLNKLKVSALALLSIGVWNLIWIVLGFSLGNHWEEVASQFSKIMKTYHIFILVLFLLLLILLGIRARGGSNEKKDD